MVKRLLLICTLFLLLSSSGHAQKTVPVCINDLAEMPQGWLPPKKLAKALKRTPWQNRETHDVNRAVKAGIDEITGFFERKPSAVQKLWDDSVEALIQVTHASANNSHLDKKIRKASRDNLSALIKTYNDFNADDVTCEEFRKVLPLALLAHRLFPAYDHRVSAIVKLTNAAYRECYSLQDATGIDPQELPSHVRQLSRDDIGVLFDASVWSVWLLEAAHMPQLKIPPRSHHFASMLWSRLKALPLPNATTFEGGARNENFVELADLATHIAHIPTAVHQYPLHIADHRDLYRFHRENFYAVMHTGDFDLFASFVDSLRQYGCTPNNDVQVRDGTRHLMNEFQLAGNQWMQGGQLEQGDDRRKDYDRVHRPWTAMLGLRERKLEPPAEGSLGAFIRKVLFSSETETRK